jgi:hypothetical protein
MPSTLPQAIFVMAVLAPLVGAAVGIAASLWRRRVRV